MRVEKVERRKEREMAPLVEEREHTKTKVHNGEFFSAPHRQFTVSSRPTGGSGNLQKNCPALSFLRDLRFQISDFTICVKRSSRLPNTPVSTNPPTHTTRRTNRATRTEVALVFPVLVI
jgi:hypothetical protein